MISPDLPGNTRPRRPGRPRGRGLGSGQGLGLDPERTRSSSPLGSCVAGWPTDVSLGQLIYGQLGAPSNQRHLHADRKIWPKCLMSNATRRKKKRKKPAWPNIFRLTKPNQTESSRKALGKHKVEGANTLLRLSRRSFIW